MKRYLAFILTSVLLFCASPLTDGIIFFRLTDRACAASTTQSGTCGTGTDGSNLSWSMDDKGVLTIKGIGKMASYDAGQSPWHHRADVKTVIVSNGVTTIGDAAFQGCAALTSVSIPDSVTYIGNDAFDGCDSLQGIVIPESVNDIGTVVTTAYCGVGGAPLAWDDLSENAIPRQTVIYGKDQSEAQEWAVSHDHLFVIIGDTSEALPLTVSKNVVPRLGGKVTIDFTVENAASKMISVSCDSECLTLTTSAIQLDQEGRGAITVNSVERDYASVTLTLQETKQKATIFVFVDVPDLGDVNADSEITPADARLALRASVKLEHYGEDTPNFRAADVDRNGIIESNDARQILRASIQLESL